MKKIVATVSLIFLCGTAFSQIYTPVNPTIYGNKNNRTENLLAAGIPSKADTTTNSNSVLPQIFYFEQDSTIWAWSIQRGFFQVGGGGGGFAIDDSIFVGGLIDTITFPNHPTKKGIIVPVSILDSLKHQFIDTGVGMTNGYVLTWQASGRKWVLGPGGGGGGTPNLNQVAHVGNITDTTIISTEAIIVLTDGSFAGAMGITDNINFSSIGFSNTLAGRNSIFWTPIAPASGTGNLYADSISTFRDWQMPDGSGYLVLTINGAPANKFGDVTVSGGGGQRFGVSTEDDQASQDRLFDLNDHNFSIQQDADDWFLIKPSEFRSRWYAEDGLGGEVEATIKADSGDGSVQFDWNANDGVNLVEIRGSASSNAITFTAGGNTFVGDVFLNSIAAGASTDSIVTINNSTKKITLRSSSSIFNKVINQRFTGSTSTTLTLSQNYVSGTIEVWKNGAKLDPSVDYSQATANTITLNSARLTGDIYLLDFNY